jgi:hypothetical protein
VNSWQYGEKCGSEDAAYLCLPGNSLWYCTLTN